MTKKKKDFTSDIDGAINPAEYILRNDTEQLTPNQEKDTKKQLAKKLSEKRPTPKVPKARPLPAADSAENIESAGSYKDARSPIEPKSRRFSLLLQPSLYDKVSVAAAAQGASVNDYIHFILETAHKGD
jgi:hypothetical protein